MSRRGTRRRRWRMCLLQRGAGGLRRRCAEQDAWAAGLTGVMKSASVSTTADIVKRDIGIGGKPNILAAERKMIQTLLGNSVGYNISDKMLGPVLYSRDLYLDQCKLVKLHLKDGKATHERISESKKQILVCVVNRLKNLLAPYSESGSAVEQLSKTA